MDAFFETYGRQKLELKSPFSGPVGGERVDVRVVARLAVVPRPGVQVRSVGRREADEELAAADDGEPRVRAAVVVVEAYKKKKRFEIPSTRASRYELAESFFPVVGERRGAKDRLDPRSRGD